MFKRKKRQMKVDGKFSEEGKSLDLVSVDVLVPAELSSAYALGGLDRRLGLWGLSSDNSLTQIILAGVRASSSLLSMDGYFWQVEGAESRGISEICRMIAVSSIMRSQGSPGPGEYIHTFQIQDSHLQRICELAGHLGLPSSPSSLFRFGAICANICLCLEAFFTVENEPGGPMYLIPSEDIIKEAALLGAGKVF